MKKVSEILDFLRLNNIEFEFKGLEDVVLYNPVSWDNYKGAGLTFYSRKGNEVLKKWEGVQDGLIITVKTNRENLEEGQFLFVETPKLVFMYVANLFKPERKAEIHPTAIVNPNAIIGKNVSIGAYSVIGDVTIGNDCVIEEHVVIKNNVSIGNNVCIYSGCIIGTPGLGSELNFSNDQMIFPHFGEIIIEDDVVIGTRSIVNQGALNPTVIGRNSHISSNCLVAHNCELGRSVYMAAGASLAGSVIVGDRSYIGFGACIKEGVTLAEQTTVGINVTVQKNCKKPGTTLMNASFPKELGELFSLKRSINK